MKYIVTIGERKFEIELDGSDSNAIINGEKINFSYLNSNGNKSHSILVENRHYELEFEKAESGYIIWSNGGRLNGDVVDEKTARFKSLMGNTENKSKVSSLKAPMPGLILKIEVEVGQKVKKGDGLVIMEAMKMENELKAPASGIIKEIKIGTRQAVDKNQTLIVFE